jgi:hypothetical protein
MEEAMILWRQWKAQIRILETMMAGTKKRGSHLGVGFVAKWRRRGKIWQDVTRAEGERGRRGPERSWLAFQGRGLHK